MRERKRREEGVNVICICSFQILMSSFSFLRIYELELKVNKSFLTNCDVSISDIFFYKIFCESVIPNPLKNAYLR